jgi:hypothetical protein
MKNYSTNELYRKAKVSHPSITHKIVDEWLKKQKPAQLIAY